MKRLLALALAATFALPSFAVLSGCNAVEGAGKDIQAGVAQIKEEARKNKKYCPAPADAGFSRLTASGVEARRLQTPFACGRAQTRHRPATSPAIRADAARRAGRARAERRRENRRSLLDSCRRRDPCELFAEAT